MARQQYGSAARPFPKREAAASVSTGWTPLDDYRSTKRRAPGVAEILQLEAIRAHCSCPQCAARRSA
ncbi:hypothetical protein ACFC26_07720 [Kitasatospora purpeofusca]|uniref:hypothetical protein n=1 Tax=Kitasatospora purpeofusca TaxID=67352 RepID=UPI0035D79BA9